MINCEIKDFKEWLTADASRKRNLNWEQVIIHYGNALKGVSLSYKDQDGTTSFALEPLRPLPLTPYLTVIKEWQNVKAIEYLETKLDLVEQKLKEWQELVMRRLK